VVAVVAAAAVVAYGIDVAFAFVDAFDPFADEVPSSSADVGWDLPTVEPFFVACALNDIAGAMSVVVENAAGKAEDRFVTW
jgi:hypothetical protein